MPSPDFRTKTEGGLPGSTITPGDHVRRARLDRGLTQKQLAELLEVTSSTVNSWEKGRSMPTIFTLPPLIAFPGYDPGSTEKTAEVLRIWTSWV